MAITKNGAHGVLLWSALLLASGCTDDENAWLGVQGQGIDLDRCNNTQCKGSQSSGPISEPAARRCEGTASGTLVVDYEVELVSLVCPDIDP